MTSLVALRSCGLVGSGALACEIFRRSSSKSLAVSPKRIDIPKVPAVVVNTTAQEKERSYTKYIIPGCAVVCFLYYATSRDYVSTKHLKRACSVLQSQISGVSEMLVKVQKRVLEKFGFVEKRLDDIERTLLSKTAELKRDLANVETMLVKMDGKIDRIEKQTKTM